MDPKTFLEILERTAEYLLSRNNEKLLDTLEQWSGEEFQPSKGGLYSPAHPRFEHHLKWGWYFYYLGIRTKDWAHILLAEAAFQRALERSGLRMTADATLAIPSQVARGYTPPIPITEGIQAEDTSIIADLSIAFVNIELALFQGNAQDFYTESEQKLLDAERRAKILGTFGAQEHQMRIEAAIARLRAYMYHCQGDIEKAKGSYRETKRIYDAAKNKGYQSWPDQDFGDHPHYQKARRGLILRRPLGEFEVLLSRLIPLQTGVFVAFAILANTVAVLGLALFWPLPFNFPMNVLLISQSVSSVSLLPEATFLFVWILAQSVLVFVIERPLLVPFSAILLLAKIASSSLKKAIFESW